MNKEKHKKELERHIAKERITHCIIVLAYIKGAHVDEYL
jgi:cytochrome b subunit of formate dehydrogenase